MYHQKTADAARYKWRGILVALGVPENSLHNRHGPCPLCGGKDRFRWDNNYGRGTYICNQCGAGTGIDLSMGFLRLDFSRACSRIDAVLGNLKPDTPSRPATTEADIRSLLKGVWNSSRPVEPGDLVDKYLAGRNLDELIYPTALRFAQAMRDGEGGVYPCMLASVGRYDEQEFDTIHRTFLKSNGLGKAEIATPRKLMPGSVPDGASVMLSEWTESGPLGIAEGIETAMAASAIFDIPVWAAVSCAMMKKWLPPRGCEEVVIFGDNDRNFTGQAAAYHLANRLDAKGYPVGRVLIPVITGEDWADDHLRTSASR